LTKFRQHFTLVSEVHEMKVITHDQIKYAAREQHKIVLIEILSNLCINLNVHIIVNYEK